jgi:hypothetical protein
MLFSPKLKVIAAMAAVLAVNVACSREIGDKCSTGTECSQTGGRTCDTTMPGGYCTIANCEPDTCPEEAACIGFSMKPSTAEACSSLDDDRGLRRFCMRRCSSQDDCRGGYICADLNADKNPWGAKRLDNGSSDGRVCALDYTAVAAIRPVGGAAGASGVGYCTAEPYEDAGYYAVGGSSGVSQNTAGNAGSAGSAGSAGATATNGTAGNAGDVGQAGSAGDVGQAGSAGE